MTNVTEQLMTEQLMTEQDARNLAQDARTTVSVA